MQSPTRFSAQFDLLQTAGHQQVISGDSKGLRMEPDSPVIARQANKLPGFFFLAIAWECGTVTMMKVEFNMTESEGPMR